MSGDPEADIPADAVESRLREDEIELVWTGKATAGRPGASIPAAMARQCNDD